MRILFWFFLSLNLCFAAFESELEIFDQNFANARQENKIKFHHQLKNLYIKSVINEDEKTRFEILKRLIISSNTLNLDDSSYANELRQSGVSEEKIELLREFSLSNAKNLAFNENEILKPQNSSFNTNELSNTQNLKPQNIAFKPNENAKAQNAVFIPNEEQILLIAANSTKKTASSNSKKYLLSSKQIAQGVEFKLDFTLSKNDIKTLILDEKGNFRHIMDFEAVLEGEKKDYKFEDFSITLSQYNPKTIRVVVRSKEKFPIGLSFDKNVFTLTAQNKSQKTAQTSKESPKKESKTTEEQKALYVLKSAKTSQGVSLSLSDDLDENALFVSSTKDSKFFRKIISFEGILEGGAKNFNFNQAFITITQFNPKVVRIVLSSAKDFEFSKEIENKNLKISFLNSNTTQKENAKQEQRQSVSKKTEENFKQSPVAPALNSSFKSGKIIVIDPGHGGKDSGAIKEKLREKDIVLNTALSIGKELKKRGYKIFYTRNTDKFINLRDRTKFANDKKADLFLSIHANAAANDSKAKTSEGLETFFLSPARSQRSKNAAEKENKGDFEEMNYFSKQSVLNFLNREKIVSSNKLAIDIQKGVLSQTRKKYKVVDRGVREAPFWVLVGAQMPAILIEIGYITHPNEGKRMANKGFQDIFARGVADGVDNYFYNNR